MGSKEGGCRVVGLESYGSLKTGQPEIPTWSSPPCPTRWQQVSFGFPSEYFKQPSLSLKWFPEFFGYVLLIHTRGYFFHCFSKSGREGGRKEGQEWGREREINVRGIYQPVASHMCPSGELGVRWGGKGSILATLVYALDWESNSRSIYV